MIGLGGLGAPIGVGVLGSKMLEGSARQPELSPMLQAKFFVVMSVVDIIPIPRRAGLWRLEGARQPTHRSTRGPARSEASEPDDAQSVADGVGRLHCQRCKQVIEDLAEIEQADSKYQLRPTGLLKISSSNLLGELHIVPAIADLVPENPSLEIELNFFGLKVDLVVPALTRLANVADVTRDHAQLRAAERHQR